MVILRAIIYVIIAKPSHIFRQAQYDHARCQSELVEDMALKNIVKEL